MYSSIVEKYEWPFGYSFQNFAFRCKKTNGRLGATVKFCVSLLKKQIVIWVHAFFNDSF